MAHYVDHAKCTFVYNRVITNYTVKHTRIGLYVPIRVFIYFFFRFVNNTRRESHEECVYKLESRDLIRVFSIIFYE